MPKLFLTAQHRRDCQRCVVIFLGIIFQNNRANNSDSSDCPQGCITHCLFFCSLGASLYQVSVSENLPSHLSLLSKLTLSTGNWEKTNVHTWVTCLVLGKVNSYFNSVWGWSEKYGNCFPIEIELFLRQFGPLLQNNVKFYCMWLSFLSGNCHIWGY